jgi:glutathione transport system permease protein
VARHFGPTLVLSVASIVFAAIVGMGIGLLQAVWRNTLPDYVSTVVSVAGISTPPFFLGLLFIYLLAVDVHWFPTGGIGSTRSLVLPAVTLGAGAAATIARFARSSLLEVLGEEYVRTARAKGLEEGRVLMKHALRNALIPVVTMIGLQFGFLLSGAIVVETVFSWPGLGWLMIQSISFRDYPVLVAEILLFSLQFLVINLLVDLLYAALDPRVAYG